VAGGDGAVRCSKEQLKAASGKPQADYKHNYYLHSIGKPFALRCSLPADRTRECFPLCVSLRVFAILAVKLLRSHAGTKARIHY
jgi:hypothetical protein